MVISTLFENASEYFSLVQYCSIRVADLKGGRAKPLRRGTLSPPVAMPMLHICVLQYVLGIIIVTITVYIRYVHRIVNNNIVILYSDSDLDGHFHFIGPELECVCKCIVDSATSQDSCQKG